MVTIDKMGGQNNIYSAELKGLSTDTKPTDGIPNGSTFYEINTQDVYMFDEENQIWIKQ